MEGEANGNDFGVDFGADAMKSDVGVDSECEIENGGAGREFDDGAFWSEEVDFLSIEGFFEFLDLIDGALFGVFESAANALEPFFDGVVVYLFVGVSFFVEEVCRHAFLGDVVHALSADLHFDPLADAGHDGGL